MVCMPWASNTSVLTSDSAPWAGTSSPFQRKVIPAALPMRAMISREAWTVVLAGAMRVSCRTSCPSEVTEIQEVSVARMTRLNDAAGWSAGFATGWPKERMVTSPFSTTCSSAFAAGVVGGAAVGLVEAGGFKVCVVFDDGRTGAAPVGDAACALATIGADRVDVAGAGACSTLPR